MTIISIIFTMSPILINIMGFTIIYLLLDWCLYDLYIPYGNINIHIMETPKIINEYQK